MRVNDAGSAVVSFVLVVPLLCLVALGLLHLILVAHARAVLVSAASEGARVAALAGSSPRLGEQRVRELTAEMVSPLLLTSVQVHPESRDGVRIMTVRIAASVPVVGDGGLRTDLLVEGHALIEGSA